MTVIDGATNGVLATVTTGSSPCALCYNPTNNKVYCANSGYYPNYDMTVTVIDGATNGVLATVTAGSAPWALCYNSTNNKVYCANLNSGNVTVMDGKTDSVLATVTAGSQPYALCYNPTNNKVYCADSNDGNVTVIDGATNGVITTVATGASPHALCHLPKLSLPSKLSVLPRKTALNDGKGTSNTLNSGVFSLVEESAITETMSDCRYNLVSLHQDDLYEANSVFLGFFFPPFTFQRRWAPSRAVLGVSPDTVTLGLNRGMTCVSLMY